MDELCKDDPNDNINKDVKDYVLKSQIVQNYVKGLKYNTERLEGFRRNVRNFDSDKERGKGVQIYN
jgi:hypothetical protein